MPQRNIAGLIRMFPNGIVRYNGPLSAFFTA